VDVANLVIGLIALVLSLFSSAYVAVQLQRFVRFRKVAFHIEDFDLPVKEDSGFKSLGLGEIPVNVRGASEAVTLTFQEMIVYTEGRSGGGPGNLCAIHIAPFEWQRIQVRFAGRIGLPQNDIPRILDVDLNLSNPDDVYVVPLRLKLSPDGSKYTYINWGHTRRYLYRTMWRHNTRLRRLIRALSRGRPG